MKPTQIVVLALALAAGGGAYFVATNMNAPTAAPAAVAKTKVVQAPTEQVLVADTSVPLGQPLKAERLRWQEWPKKGVVEGMVVKSADPEAIEGHAKLIARATFYPGEPIRAEKLVRSDRGYMSAILPKGYRAVAVQVSAVTTAGGFILPNDRVDVMVTSRGEGEINSSSEVVLRNVRVLAIDRLIEEKEDGSKSIVGDTATLQVTPAEAALLTESRVDAGATGGTLSLVLRSVADSGANADDAAVTLTGSKKRMIKAGQVSRFKVEDAIGTSASNATQFIEAGQQSRVQPN